MRLESSAIALLLATAVAFGQEAAPPRRRFPSSPNGSKSACSTWTWTSPTRRGSPSRT